RQPDKLVVVWTRRSRRKSSKAHSWQPGIKNPYRGVVVWPVPENIEITVTLFKGSEGHSRTRLPPVLVPPLLSPLITSQLNGQKDPHAEEFEDKEWTFVIENERKGKTD
ncbi:hypothetical protein FQN60_014727, partial [Etheostoma spectabile]